MNSDRNATARRPRKGILVVSAVLLLVLVGALVTRAQNAPNAKKEPAMSDLLKVPGKVIAQSDSAEAAGKFRVRNYRLEELTLPSAVEVEVGGKRVEVTRAFRLTVTGGPFPVRAMPPVLWLNDEPVGYGVAITAVTFDASLVREGATIYLSYGDKENKQDRTALPSRLALGGAKGGNQ
jgi:hypothetical protein